jgi:hypothetical protein
MFEPLLTQPVFLAPSWSNILLQFGEKNEGVVSPSCHKVLMRFCLCSINIASALHSLSALLCFSLHFVRGLAWFGVSLAALLQVC